MSVEAFRAAVLRDAAAVLRRVPGPLVGGGGEPLAVAMRAEDLAGRRELLAEARGVTFADDDLPPPWIRETLRVYTRAVGEIYAQRVSRDVARRVEKILADAARTGARDVRDRVLAAMVGPSAPVAGAEAHALAAADTAWATMLAGARAAGRFRAAQDLDRSSPIALRFRSCHDQRVRPNHLAADGLTARPADPVWLSLAPPLGFNCRCKLEVVPAPRPGPGSRFDPAPRLARVPAGAGPDPGFDHAGRPDAALYGF